MQRCLLFLLLCFVVPASAGADIKQLPPDMQAILSNKRLVVAIIKQDVPPFISRDKGKFTGIDITLANEIAHELGVELVFNEEANTFDEVVEQVAAHKADMAISMLSITLPRAIKVNFSTPYLVLHQALLVNRVKAVASKLDSDPMAILNRPNTTIGVLENSSYITFAKKLYPYATLVPYKDIEQAMQDTNNGRLFAFYFDEIQIKNWLRIHPSARLYVQIYVFANQIDPLGIAVPWQNSQVLRWLNLYLDNFRHSQTYKKFVTEFIENKP